MYINICHNTQKQYGRDDHTIKFTLFEPVVTSKKYNLPFSYNLIGIIRYDDILNEFHYRNCLVCIWFKECLEKSDWHYFYFHVRALFQQFISNAKGLIWEIL